MGSVNSVNIKVTLVLVTPDKRKRKEKKSSPATRHGGAWGRGGIAPTHS
jgi:hypothetical protein